MTARPAGPAWLPLLTLLLAGAAGLPAQGAGGRAILSHAPAVPPPLVRRPASRVVVHLETREVRHQLADGVDYTAWTFGGQVPGQFIRVREGDRVEFHLDNHPDSRMPHNIDLNAVTGPGGGAAVSFTAPGHSTSFEFLARNPGLFVYHCAAVPVGMHVANGMYGLMLVEPAGGLTPVRREYYLMLGEFYTDGAFGEPGTRAFSWEKALAETPDYVVFNGAVGSLTGDRALVASVGETVRLFVGNGGPNLTASFHISGETFDRVYLAGSSQPLTNVETVPLPPGSAAIVEFTVDVPGTYPIADHALFRAFNKGALATLRVDGPPNPALYTGRVGDEVYLLEGATAQVLPARRDSARGPKTVAEQIEAGRRIFSQTCQACHQADGRGIPGSFPPLAGSDFLNADLRRAVGIVLNGLQGPVVVNGRTYNAVMPALRLTDDNVADVLTYVYSQWGNSGKVVPPSLVSQIRLCPWCETGGRPPGQ